MKYKYKIYRDLSELPIINWEAVQDSNDLRHLLILDSYVALPDIHKYLHRDLQRIYARMVERYPKQENRIIKYKKKVIELLIDLVLDITRNSNDVDKLCKASKVLRALMIDSSHEKFLWDVDFTETPEQKSMLTELSIAVKKYNNQVERIKSAPKRNIYEQTTEMETVLGIKIDIKTTSVLQYLAYIKTTNKKINTQKSWQN